MNPRLRGRKDLRGLHGLPRSSFWAHLHRHARSRTQPGTEGRPGYLLLAAFSGHWWRWVLDYLRNRFGAAHPFATYPLSGDVGLYDMPDRVRIALAGDWGTGTDEAEEVAQRIRSDEPDYTVHLGDTYYVGDREETRENFLGISLPEARHAPCAWPRGTRGSFALLGNHEMYSRAFAYFEDMLPTLGPVEDGQSRGQRASYFCLENRDWRVIGLDTGYRSQGAPLLEYVHGGNCALPNALIAWLRDVVRFDPADRRGIVLLSHHQNYSRFDDWTPAPAQQLAALFDREVIWFWGHEHRLAIYRPFKTPGGLLAHGRCIGHGGMPVDLPPRKPLHPECATLFVDARPYPNDEGLHVGFNGYARLDFRAERLRVNYVDLKGDVVFAETFTTKDGALSRVTESLAPASE